MHSLPKPASLRRWIFSAGILLSVFWTGPAPGMPFFARQYETSCAQRPNAFPRLNEFGEYFRDSNFRLPGWKEKLTVNTGDGMLALA